MTTRTQILCVTLRPTTSTVVQYDSMRIQFQRITFCYCFFFLSFLQGGGGVVFGPLKQILIYGGHGIVVVSVFCDYKCPVENYRVYLMCMLTLFLFLFCFVSMVWLSFFLLYLCDQVGLHFVTWNSRYYSYSVGTNIVSKCR